ncbi:hypothetical protein [Streptosporangium canum]|uniref:hypothetical protein n=1 Tax=Streptosporangium canum TaxID=324952 RepID=UPI0037A040D1
MQQQADDGMEVRALAHAIIDAEILSADYVISVRTPTPGLTRRVHLLLIRYFMKGTRSHGSEICLPLATLTTMGFGSSAIAPWPI